MAEQRRFLLGKEPFIRKADRLEYGTDVIMRDFIIALLPLILFGWIKNGLMPYLQVEGVSFFTMIKPLAMVFIGGFSSFLMEYIAYRFFLKDPNPLKKIKDSFAAIPGILLAMILSVNTPIWVIIIGCFFATIIGKLLFGGFGYNIFNPALVGYLFISVAYYAVIQSNGGYANPAEIDILAGVTPMTNFSANKVASIETLVSPYGNLWDFFIGTIPGSLAETSSLLCIVAYIYLVVRKVINWKVPVIYVGTVFVLTYLIGAFNGYALDLRYALFGILSGGLMFGAVFMATEPVTSPKTPNGKVIFALFLGVLTVLFRYNGNMPEGVATSIMLMNLFTIIIDRIGAKMRVESKVKKVVTTYGVIALILIGISCYTVLGYANSVSYNVEDATVVSVKQDLESKNFVYSFEIGTKRVEVEINFDNEIISISDTALADEEAKKIYTEKITQYNEKNYDRFPYLYDVQKDNNNTILIIKSKRPLGYAAVLTFEVTLDENGKIISFKSDSKSKESYTNENYEGWNGIHPEDVLPAKIIEKQENIDESDVVATATQTSNVMIKVAKFALNYGKEVLK